LPGEIPRAIAKSVSLGLPRYNLVLQKQAKADFGFVDFQRFNGERLISPHPPVFSFLLLLLLVITPA
jgi:hypothetical protein